MNQLHLKQEAVRCLLCENAPCTAACGQGDPARAVRAVCFDNQVLGARLFAACSEADLEAAEKACIHYDRPVRLREIAKSLPAPTPETELPSLEIDFCGLHTRWWPRPWKRAGRACSTRPSACRKSRRFLPASTP